MFPPDQVYSYDCKYAGIVEGRVALSGVNFILNSISYEVYYWIDSI